VSKTYSDGERIAALAILAANGGNISQTTRQTGIPRITLRKWQASELNDLPQVATIKAEVTQSFIEKAKSAREVFLDRLVALAPQEKDMFKLAGAFKIVNDAARLEDGQATTRSEVRTLDDDPERARLARAAADALERDWEGTPHLN
jgi:hypothetical protein